MNKTFLLSLCFIFSGSILSAEPYEVHPDAPDLPAEVDLKTALDYALEHNFALLQAKERIREQHGLLIEVKAQTLPTLAINATYNEEDPAMTRPLANENNWSLSIGVTQVLYAGGGLSASVQAQQEREHMARHEFAATLDAVILDVKTRFYDVLLARDTIAVQEENIELLKEQLLNVRSRFEAGSVSNFDVLQAEVSLANARPALIRARNALRIASEELRKSVGYMNVRKQNLRRVPLFVGELSYNPVAFDLDNALYAAISNRPELKLLEGQVEAQELGMDVARAGYRPTVSATGRYDIRRTYQLRDRFYEPDKGWYAGVSSTWNLFDGHATRGKMVQAKSQLRQAQLQLKETQLDIEVEVRRAISGLQEATELTEAARQVTTQAEEALRVANERYNVGSSTYLDILQARVSLTDARNNELQANYSYLVAVANFQRAIGEITIR